MQRCSLRAVAEGEEEQKGISFSANRNAVSAYFLKLDGEIIYSLGLPLW
jgi:hypothetical protein